MDVLVMCQDKVYHPDALLSRNAQDDPILTEQGISSLTSGWGILQTDNEGGCMMGVQQAMELDKRMNLADLMYGHGGKFICHLSGQFNPEKYPGAPPIQICQMKCGCWIVGDGNNRVGLILRNNPEATIADIPMSLLAIARFGKWDSETMDWWNPCAISFRDAMTKQNRQSRELRDAIYGFIERDEEGTFFACVSSNKTMVAVSATGRTADETKILLEEKVRTLLKRERILLVLTSTNPLENHQCTLQS